MAGELDRFKKAVRDAKGTPQVMIEDIVAIAEVADAAIDYLDMDGVVTENGSLGQKNSLRLAYMNLKLRAEGVR